MVLLLVAADCGRWIRLPSAKLRARSAVGTPRYLCGCWWYTILSRISTPFHQHAPLLSLFPKYVIYKYAYALHRHPLSRRIPTSNTLSSSTLLIVLIIPQSHPATLCYCILLCHTLMALTGALFQLHHASPYVARS